MQGYPKSSRYVYSFQPTKINISNKNNVSLPVLYIYRIRREKRRTRRKQFIFNKKTRQFPMFHFSQPAVEALSKQGLGCNRSKSVTSYPGWHPQEPGAAPGRRELSLLAILRPPKRGITHAFGGVYILYWFITKLLLVCRKI